MLFSSYSSRTGFREGVAWVAGFRSAEPVPLRYPAEYKVPTAPAAREAWRKRRRPPPAFTGEVCSVVWFMRFSLRATSITLREGESSVPRPPTFLLVPLPREDAPVAVVEPRG